MLRFPGHGTRRTARRVIAGAWLGAFSLLWASLPALDARANHPGRAFGVQAAESDATDAGHAVAAADRCEFCDLLNSGSGTPIVPATDAPAPAWASALTFAGALAATSTGLFQAPARAPPTA